MKTKVWVQGVSGRTGSFVPEALSKSVNYEYVGGHDQQKIYGVSDQKEYSSKVLGEMLQNVDALIDFSTPQANNELLQALKLSGTKNKIILIATTSIKEEVLKDWEEYSKRNSCKILIASNTSLGVLVLLRFCKQYAEIFFNNNFDFDILEWHHKGKQDSPGGTSKSIINTLIKATNGKLEICMQETGARSQDKLGVHVMRSGNVFGEHQITFTSNNERFTISHQAFNRTLFAEGAVYLLSWLSKQNSGFYNMDSLISEAI